MHQFRPEEGRFYGPGPQHYMRPESDFMAGPQYYSHQGAYPQQYWHGEPGRFDHYGRGGPMHHR
ncbi:unnamed protein product, partial [Dibothriocephalus latus]